jgi:two-component system chemotaxis response regulator CheY
VTAILTVDDSVSIRQTVRMALSGEGYVVTEAVNGQDGLEKSGAGGFDLIVTDLNMPVMDGLAMIRELRKRPAGAGVPILFLTTEADPEIKGQAKAAGATGWLNKPIDRQQLVRAVKKALVK